jgi:hypothetical protein
VQHETNGLLIYPEIVFESVISEREIVMDDKNSVNENQNTGIPSAKTKPTPELDADSDVSRCEVEWDAPKSSLCRPHQCDLLQGHEGNHVCDCGWARRRMKRDEPDV